MSRLWALLQGLSLIPVLPVTSLSTLRGGSPVREGPAFDADSPMGPAFDASHLSHLRPDASWPGAPWPGAGKGGFNASALMGGFMKNVNQAWAVHEGGAIPKDPTHPIVYHMHIPKTAGTSFKHDAPGFLTGTGMQFVSTEACLSYQKELNPLKGVAAFFREPRTHALSQYHHCTDGDFSYVSTRNIPAKFEDWLQAWASLRTEGKDTQDYSGARNTTGIEGLHESRLPYRCYNPVNLQSHWLTCDKTYDFSNDNKKLADPLAVIEAMESLWFVGLAEAYPESLCLFHTKVHGELPSWCSCEALKLRQTTSGHATHETFVKHRESNVHDFSESTLATLDSLTDVDRILYRAAIKRFVADIRATEKKFKRKIVCEDALLSQGRSLSNQDQYDFVAELTRTSGGGREAPQTPR